MKKLSIVALFAVAFTLSVNAQKMSASKVPTAVRASFSKQYPATIAKWEKEKENYEAGFKKNGHIMSALFSADGKMQESEVSINAKGLPAAATAYLNSNYKNVKVKEAAKITKSNGAINYEAEVNGKDLIFDANGNFVKEVKA